jgi:hypothetical protein
LKFNAVMGKAIKASAASRRRGDPSAQEIAASAADLARTAEDLEHAVRRFKVAGPSAGRFSRNRSVTRTLNRLPSHAHTPSSNNTVARNA